jgi:hypothetical protein
VRAGLKPDTRHLKPILRKGFITPDNVQEKRAVFRVNYEVWTRENIAEYGVCPAAAAPSFDPINSGKCRGRIRRAVAGTFRIGNYLAK